MSQMKAIVDPLLSDASSMYQPQGCIAEQVLPALKSATSTGKIASYGKQHLIIENSVRGGRGQYRRVESITRATSSYAIEGHGLEGLVTAEDYRNVIQPFDAEQDETIGLSSQILLEKEYILASKLTDTAVLTQNTTLAGTAQLSDFANSDPLAQFQAGRSAVRNGCGLPPNAALMDWSVWNVLRFHPQLMDYLGFKYNRAGGLTDDELAKALGVDKVMVASAVYNTAKEGQTATMSSIWGKNMVFAVLPDKAQKRQITLGYTVVYDGQPPRKVYKYAVNNPPESTGILVEDNYCFYLADVGAAYLIKNAIA